MDKRNENNRCSKVESMGKEDAASAGKGAPEGRNDGKGAAKKSGTDETARAQGPKLDAQGVTAVSAETEGRASTTPNGECTGDEEGRKELHRDEQWEGWKEPAE